MKNAMTKISIIIIATLGLQACGNDAGFSGKPERQAKKAAAPEPDPPLSPETAEAEPAEPAEPAELNPEPKPPVKIQKPAPEVEDTIVFDPEPELEPEPEPEIEPPPPEPIVPQDPDATIIDQVIGINFEDKGNEIDSRHNALDGKGDYNDGVVCIEGKFQANYKTGTLHSLIDQTVNIKYRDGSGAHVNILALAVSGPKDNQVTNEIFPEFFGPKRSSKLMQATYAFKKGDAISITFNDRYKNSTPSDPSFQPSPHIRFQKDQCNLTGN